MHQVYKIILKWRKCIKNIDLTPFFDDKSLKYLQIHKFPNLKLLPPYANVAITVSQSSSQWSSFTSAIVLISDSSLGNDTFM